MSSDNGNENPVVKARAVLHEAVAAAGLSEFTAMAVLAAAESYAKAMLAACTAHADRSAASR